MCGDYTIHESICDENLVYIVVEAAPKEGDKYLLIPQDYLEEDNEESLGLDGVKDSTIGEYADSIGKELIYTGITLFSDSCSTTYEINADGTLECCITAMNDQGTGNIDLTCVATAYKKGMETVVRVEQECTVTNYSSSIKRVYMMDSDDLTGDTGIVQSAAYRQ